LIGSFHPPRAVVYDTQLLHTLNDREIRSGYAELVKEALIGNQSFYHSLLNTDLQSLTNEQLEYDLYKGMQIKTKIVEKDEHEHNVRMYLNLGHTFGHALEAELGYGRITHGEAVALGLLFALRVSVEEFSQTLSLSDLLDWMQHNHYPLD